jgi:hypothetical protein
MNECDESFPATESRKKKRGSGFRFSSKKVLDRYRLKRLAKARDCEVTSVTRTLSYPSLIPNEVCASDFQGSAATSCESPVLVTVDEFEQERKESSDVDYFKESEYPKKVSSFSVVLTFAPYFHFSSKKISSVVISMSFRMQCTTQRHMIMYHQGLVAHTKAYVNFRICQIL